MPSAAQGIVLSRPAPAGYARALRNPLYDTDVQAAGAVGQIIFFQRPQGQTNSAAVVKTEADTNLTIGGQLAQPNMFDLFGMQHELLGPAAAPSVPVLADYRLHYLTGVYQFSFGTQRKWLEVPLTRIPQGPSLQTGGATVAVQNVNWGFPSVREFYPFVKPTGKPYRIKAGETFQVKVYWPGGAVTLSAASIVKTYIIGIYYIAL